MNNILQASKKTETPMVHSLLSVVCTFIMRMFTKAMEQSGCMYQSVVLY
jgi:hypothetical protein